LRTVDDIFLDVAAWSRIGPHRSTLAQLHDLGRQLDLRHGAAVCASLRTVSSSPAFSVTVSFVGKRNYNTAEIKQILAESITTTHHWRYVPEDTLGELSIRLFIEHETAFVGLRLGRTPLHERPYKLAHQAGSLKPTIAAAMLRLAGTAPGQVLIDPCCGAGTILAEAAGLGAIVQGGDNDPAAIEAARANTKAAGITAQLSNWDIRALPLADSSVDRVVSNLPWGRQVMIDNHQRSFYRKACAEIRRVLAPEGRIAILTHDSRLLQFEDLCKENQIEISLFGQKPTIMIFSAARPRR
jgi:23S rRNA G2445 N2-methylase RlmL